MSVGLNIITEAQIIPFDIRKVSMLLLQKITSEKYQNL